MPLNVLFAGTPHFALPCLHALMASAHRVVAVYTQPDRPAGRGRRLTASPVKQLAQEKNLPVLQPASLGSQVVQQALRNYNADIMVVVAYGLLLPPVVLTAPRLGCINVHASLLPRWRGAAPIQHALWAGDAHTGITIMQMDAGLDTGAILMQTTCAITVDDTSHSVHDRLATLGAETLLSALARLQASTLTPQPQEEQYATYAPKITKAQAELNWQLPAAALARQIRALNPTPIAFTRWGERNVRIWQAHAVVDHHQAQPGTVMQIDKAGITVATGDGLLCITRLQLPGGRPLAVGDFINAQRDALLAGRTQLG